MLSSVQEYLEHPEDVLGFIVNRHKVGIRCALLIVTGLSGGSVRSLGTLVAVDQSGRMAGYVSNGCIDADLVLQAQGALNDKITRMITYGKGSTFIDLQLPCGGSIDILIIPDPSANLIAKAKAGLMSRQQMTLSFHREKGLFSTSSTKGETGWFGNTFIASHTPKLKFFIAGRGASLFAMVNTISALNYNVAIATPDLNDLPLLESIGAYAQYHLTSPNTSPVVPIDKWTAVLLLFHDHEWETQLICTCLAGNPFYIGALGSERTHEARLEGLRDIGLSEQNIAHIRGPIGLIPSVRDASMLVISTLAEIASEYRKIDTIEEYLYIADYMLQKKNANL